MLYPCQLLETAALLEAAGCLLLAIQFSAPVRQNQAIAVLGFPTHFVAQVVAQIPAQAAVPVLQYQAAALHLIPAIHHLLFAAELHHCPAAVPHLLFAALHPFPLAHDLSRFAVYFPLLLPAVLAVL